MLTRTLRRVAAVLCVAAPLAAQASPYGGLYVGPDGPSDDARDFAILSAIDAPDPQSGLALPIQELGAGPIAVLRLTGTLVATLSPHGQTTSLTSNAAGTDGAGALDPPISGRAVHSATRAEPHFGHRPALVVGVPEPSEMALIFIGLFAIVWIARRTAARARKRRSST